MTKENALFAGGLILIVAVLATVCVWIGRSQPTESRQTGERRNPYLIEAPKDNATTNAAIDKP